MELSKEDERRENGWRGVQRKRTGGKRKKRYNASSSSGRTESEGREEEERIPKEKLLNVVSRFQGEEGVKKVDPLKLTKIISWRIEIC